VTRRLAHEPPGWRPTTLLVTAAKDAVLAEGKRVLIDDTTRFDGVKVIGADEHVWRHTRRGDKYVVEGRSKQAFKTWLAQRSDAWRDAVEVVAMDGFTGFKTATTEELPDAVTVMDPFHVVRLAGRPGTSNGPTEAINGRLEHLRGSALGFRNLANYIARSLLETGGFRPRLHPRS
jgi:hypothetical protein